MPQLSNRPPQMVRYAGDKARVSINGKYTHLGKWGSDQARTKYNTLIAKWREDQDSAKLAIEDRTLIAELTADYIDFVKDSCRSNVGRSRLLNGRYRHWARSPSQSWPSGGIYL